MQDKIVEIGRSWLGTKWQHNQCCKGVGVDCVRFLYAVGEELSYQHLPELENYPRVPNGNSLIENLRKGLDEIPSCDAAIGDILVFKTSYSGIPTHVGIKTDRGLIHADQRVGKVVETGLGYWERLLVAAFRLRN